MQTLRYEAHSPPPPPFEVLPRTAGNNWDDPAYHTDHRRPNSMLGNYSLRNEPRSPKPRVLSSPRLRFATTATLREIAEKHGKDELVTPKWLSLDDKVCRFFAYFTEPVVEGPTKEQIRRVEIYYYPADHTIMIIEPKVPNSGLLGGMVLKRQRVPLALETRRKKAAVKLSQSADLFRTRIATEDLVKEKIIKLDDFVVGEDVNIYGRTYHIVDSDAGTRDFLESLGEPLAAPSPYPDDPYFTEFRAQLDNHSSKRRMNPEDRDLKMSIEQHVKGYTTMHYPEAVARFRKFLADDKTVLAFDAIWEDRDMPHGDLRTFEIRYYLWDDTVEVLERLKPNSGRDETRAFVQRRRLAKERENFNYDLTFSRPNVASNEPGVYYNPEDFMVGAYINVYGRPLRLVACDPFTRHFYRVHLNIDQGIPIDVDREYGLQAKETAPNYPPPHNGYGTEEDSLGNWRNIMLKPPKTDLKKWMELDGAVLKFAARFFHPTSSEDASRRFTVAFYLGDDTVAVAEISGRNTGMVGGRFLKRQPVKKFDGEGRSCNYTWQDFHVGAVVNLLGHVFELTETDENTRRIRWHTCRLPPGIDVAAVERCVHQWLGSVEGSKAQPLGSILEKAQDAVWDDTSRVVLDLMRLYDADYGHTATLADFLLTIAGDLTRALHATSATSPEGSEAAQAKAERRQVVCCEMVAHRLCQELSRRHLKFSDAFRVISTFPSSKRDIAGSNNANHLNMTINMYQFLAACRESFHLPLSEEEVSSITQELFPEHQRQMALPLFVEWLKKAQNPTCFSPIRTS